jgi:hypothetical protein
VTRESVELGSLRRRATSSSRGDPALLVGGTHRHDLLAPRAGRAPIKLQVKTTGGVSLPLSAESEKPSAKGEREWFVLVALDEHDASQRPTFYIVLHITATFVYLVRVIAAPTSSLRRVPCVR